MIIDYGSSPVFGGFFFPGLDCFPFETPAPSVPPTSEVGVIELRGSVNTGGSTGGEVDD